MVSRRKPWQAALLGVTFLLAGSGAGGAFNITVDENGRGTAIDSIGNVFPLASFLADDPGPGGRDNVLAWFASPFAPGRFLSGGDVQITDNGEVQDVIRFIGSGQISSPCFRDTCLFLYSANLDGVDSIADTAGLPTAFLANLVNVPEIGSESNNSVIYTPLPGQPGFGPGAIVTTYTFITDVLVPEPDSLAILLIGLVGLGLTRNRSRKFS